MITTSSVKQELYEAIDHACGRATVQLTLARNGCFYTPELTPHSSEEDAISDTELVEKITQKVLAVLKTEKYNETGLPPRLFRFRKMIKGFVQEKKIDSSNIPQYQYFDKIYKNSLKAFKRYDYITEHLLTEPPIRLTDVDTVVLSAYIKTLNAEYSFLNALLKHFVLFQHSIDTQIEFIEKHGEIEKAPVYRIRGIPLSCFKILKKILQNDLNSIDVSMFTLLKNSLSKFYIDRADKIELCALLQSRLIRHIENRKPELQVPFRFQLQQREINSRYYDFDESYGPFTDNWSDEYDKKPFYKCQNKDDLLRIRKLCEQMLLQIKKWAHRFDLDYNESLRKYKAAFSLLEKKKHPKSNLKLIQIIRKTSSDFLPKVSILNADNIKPIHYKRLVKEYSKTINKDPQIQAFKGLIQFIFELKDAPSSPAPEEIALQETGITELTSHFEKSLQLNEHGSTKLIQPQYICSNNTSEFIQGVTLHDRVERWVEETRKPFLEDAKYRSILNNEALLKKVYIFHTLSISVLYLIDIRHYALQTELPSTKYADSTQYALPCILQIETINSEVTFKGAIISCINDETKEVWHCCFTEREQDEVIQDFIDDRIYDYEFPKLSDIYLKKRPSTKKNGNQKNQLINVPNGSFIQEKTSDYILIRDPKNKASVKILIHGKLSINQKPEDESDKSNPIIKKHENTQ